MKMSLLFYNHKKNRRRNGRDGTFGRRALLCLLIFSVIAAETLLLTGCGNNEATRKSDLSRQEMRNTIYDLLEIPRAGAQYPEAVNDYIINKAKELGLKPKKDKHGNLRIDLPATPGQEHRPLTILQCGTGAIPVPSKRIVFHVGDPISPTWDKATDSIRGSGVSMGARNALGVATILTVLRKAEVHGPVRAVFTRTAPDKEGSVPWKTSVSAKWLDGDILISLDSGKTDKIVTSSPAGAILTGAQPLTPAAVQNKNACVLAASGFPDGNAHIVEDQRVNPVEVLTDVLAQAMGEGIVYELTSFQSGTDAMSLPAEATAVVSVGDYEYRRFRAIFNQIADDYLDRMKDTAPDAKIQMIETKAPAQALAKQDASRIITFLFGLFDANFKKNAAEPVAINPGKLIITPDSFHCDLSVLSEKVDALNQIIQDQSAIARLSDIQIVRAQDIPGFSEDGNSERVAALARVFQEVLGEKPSFDTLPSVSVLGSLSEKNPNLPVAGLGVDILNEGKPDEGLTMDSLTQPADILMEYLKQL